MHVKLFLFKLTDKDLLIKKFIKQSQLLRK